MSHLESVGGDILAVTFHWYSLFLFIRIAAVGALSVYSLLWSLLPEHVNCHAYLLSFPLHLMIRSFNAVQ